ncbi:MAG: hypothetical protein JW909_07250 [Planctomycetes bacterium]|nr:hypothetical protein [Planctomycetota bacterium]
MAACCFCMLQAEEDGAEQLPPQVLKEGRENAYLVSPFELTQSSVFTIMGGRNSLVMQVRPDGTMKVLRMFGALSCRMAVQGESIGFQLLSAQRVNVWPLSKMTFYLDRDVLVANFSTPSWAVALEAEYAGDSGIQVSFRGKMGVLKTGQRMDALLGDDNRIVLVRSGRDTTPAAFDEREGATVAGQLGAGPRAVPDSAAPPKAWFRPARWTSLPLLPVVLWPERPVEASP